MGVCFEKSGADPFFLKKLEKKGRMDFMSNQKKKGLSLAKKHNLTGPASGNPVDWLDEFLSDDSGVHTVSSDRYGCKPEL